MFNKNMNNRAAQGVAGIFDNPPSAPTPKRIEVIAFRELIKNTLRGFLTLSLPTGMVLHDCTYHVREDGRPWIGFPGRQYTGKDGAVAWARIIDFDSHPTGDRFQREALEAAARYFLANPAASVATAAKPQPKPDELEISDRDISF